ncbi:hypothetical protein A4G18_09130 [Pasteurellaceae bacterium Pebbles2]|nr:hypothetical protein [Pasteurellaceae bacterium Pebbles2]
MMKKSVFFITALFSILGLSGCVNPPQGLERDEFTIQSLQKIEEDHYACQCKTVRLAGKVLNATALKNQTRIEVISLPVSYYSAKPVLDSSTDGRFIAYLNGFVDPESLKEQYITVKGTLTGKEQGKIDQADYQYPVVNAQNFKQWRLTQEYYYDPDDFDDSRFGYGFGAGFGWGRFGGFWHVEPKLRYVLH